MFPAGYNSKFRVRVQFEQFGAYKQITNIRVYCFAMQTFLLLALSATASAYIATPSFLGGKIGSSAAIARSSEFGLRLRQGNAARMAPAQIQMMAAAAKKKSVADLTRRELEGKKVCRYSAYF
jgi:hypothetical protein